MRYPTIAFLDIPKRIVAYLIDWILLRYTTKMVLNILYTVGMSTVDGFTSPKNLVTLVIYFSYFVLMTKLTNGYTLGKMIMGMRVVSMDEAELSWGTVITRELIGGFVLRQLWILRIITLFTEYRQSLADLFAETGVISEARVSYNIEEPSEKQMSFIEEI